MTDQIEQSCDNSARFLRWAAAAFAIRVEPRIGLSAPRHKGLTDIGDDRRHWAGRVRGDSGRDDIYRTPPVPEAAFVVRLASALKSSFCRLSAVADSAAISTSTASIQKCARTSGEITRAGIDIAPFSGRVVEMRTRRIAAA